MLVQGGGALLLAMNLRPPPPLQQSAAVAGEEAASRVLAVCSPARVAWKHLSPLLESLAVSFAQISLSLCWAQSTIQTDPMRMPAPTFLTRQRRESLQVQRPPVACI